MIAWEPWQVLHEGVSTWSPRLMVSSPWAEALYLAYTSAWQVPHDDTRAV